jgi:rhamnogalacturonyl hydrolase YesR
MTQQPSLISPTSVLSTVPPSRSGRPDLTETEALPKPTPFLQPSTLATASRFAERSLQDMRGTTGNIAPLNDHLAAAIAWLKRAHEASPDEGVSWGYSLKGAWRQLSYRETSGYIAETFFDIANFQADADAKKRAIAICHWLISVQNADGGFSNPRYTSDGIVFDTGQVLQGLVKGYQATGDSRIGEAAKAAATWLVNAADDNGRWTRYTHNNIPHVYNSRVAWILLQHNSVMPTADQSRVARANLDWAVSQQQPSGLFDQCAFVPDTAPFTHTIAYAIRGLLEAGYILKDSRYNQAATEAARAVMQQVRPDGFIAGQLTLEGKAEGNYCCLTGNCQMAIIWLKLYQQTGDLAYYQAAQQSLTYVMSTQDIATSDINVKGGIKGSQPIWGPYARLSYPNWATKFFIDALMLLSQIQSQAPAQVQVQV